MVLALIMAGGVTKYIMKTYLGMYMRTFICVGGCLIIRLSKSDVVFCILLISCSITEHYYNITYIWAHSNWSILIISMLCVITPHTQLEKPLISSLGFVSGQWPCNNVPRTYHTLQIRTLLEYFQGCTNFTWNTTVLKSEN